MKHLSAIALVGIFVAVALPSCTSSGFDRRKVKIVDEDGKPIAGAATFPQPFVAGRKQSGIDGSLWVYGFSRQADFRVGAPGYEQKAFRFDQPSNRCVLEKSKR